MYLRNYATLNIRDVLARLPGMGDVRVFGAGDYSMRMWLDPQKLAARDLTTGDVVDAIREQNVQVAAGQIGGRRRRRRRVPARAQRQGRLVDEEEFGNIIIKTGDDGDVVRLRDVARIELGAADYALRSPARQRERGRDSGLPGARARMRSSCRHGPRRRWRAEEEFPARHGLQHHLRPDGVRARSRSRRSSTRCSRPSLLVVLVVILFLQTWRASIIPLVAVPVSIIGTFAVLHALGFSINTLSLFGLVLAIGIVVDDAIVVVENVERHIARGLTPREATKLAMGEVSRPDHRDHAGAVRGVHPGRFVERPHGAVLSPVRADHRHLDGDLGVQLADALARAGRGAAQAAWAKPDALTRGMDKLFGAILRALQSWLRGPGDALLAKRLPDGPARADRDRHLCAV